MSVTQQAVAIDRGFVGHTARRRGMFSGINGADYVWAVAFAVPYAMIFFAFVVYPICYGLWLGSEPKLYTQLWDDPRYFTTVVNTLIYVGLGVNLMLALAFLLSGFFLHKRWWVKTLLVIYILPWATPALPAYMSIHWLMDGQWGMMNNLLWFVFGIDGPVYLNSRWMGLAANIGADIWKNLPFWTVILLAGRMSIPQELYEAASVDGAGGMRKFTNVTYPLMANLYLVCVLLATVFALGNFNATYFVSGGGPAMSTEVLATLGIRYAYTLSLPRLGVAEVMTALPILIPLVYILMRKLRVSEGQL